MARRAEGWKLVLRGSIYRVRFSFKTKRYEITTGESDPRKAAIVAAQIYADVISGRVTVSSSGALTHPSTSLAELCADWIAAIETELGRQTGTTYTVYAKHWAEFFETIGQVTTGNAAKYSRARLASVVRETVIKELSALRRFLLWCFDEGLVREMPEIRTPSAKATGKRHAQGRSAPMPLSPEQVEAILEKLPELSRVRAGKTWPIRKRFVFAYETALRPEAVDRLEERDLTPFGLHIRPELDKNRWERVIPLSARALAILTGLLTGTPGRPFFGDHDRRESWRKAAVAALGEAAGKRVTPYDLKHARVTLWYGEGKNPMGVRFLTGVNEAIERYTHPSRSAADSVLRGDSGAGAGSSQCEGGDLNPHESYPTSTSSKSDTTNQQETGERSVAEDATCGTEEPLSGAPPQIDEPSARYFRAMAWAWFERRAA